jgi:hypothetical protein
MKSTSVFPKMPLVTTAVFIVGLIFFHLQFSANFSCASILPMIFFAVIRTFTLGLFTPWLSTYTVFGLLDTLAGHGVSRSLSLVRTVVVSSLLIVLSFTTSFWMTLLTASLFDNFVTLKESTHLYTSVAQLLVVDAVVMTATFLSQCIYFGLRGRTVTGEINHIESTKWAS